MATPLAPESAGKSADVWVAGVQGGAIGLDGGATNPFGTLSLTRFRKNTYLRTAFTLYRSRLRQVDATVPSTYAIGSLGGGGTFGGWAVDAHVSYGRQAYGAITTALGRRDSAIDGSDYFAAGARLGRVWQPLPQWYLTPIVSIEHVRTRSLRHGLEGGRPFEFEVAERAWTGSAGLRLDRSFGRDRQSYAGVSLSHFASDNGLTLLTISPGAMGAVSRPESWQQAEASATIALSPRLWLDGQVQRTIGVSTGNATTVTAGLRLRL